MVEKKSTKSMKIIIFVFGEKNVLSGSKWPEHIWGLKQMQKKKAERCWKFMLRGKYILSMKAIDVNR